MIISGEVTSCGSSQRKCIYNILGLNNNNGIISNWCDLIINDQFDYVHLVGKVSGSPLKKIPNKEKLDNGHNNRNAKDEKIYVN